MEKLITKTKNLLNIAKEEKKKLFEDVKKGKTAHTILFPPQSYEKILNAKKEFENELNEVLQNDIAYKDREKFLKIYHSEVDTHLVYICAAMNLYKNVSNKEMKENINQDYQNLKLSVKKLTKKLKKYIENDKKKDK